MSWRSFRERINITLYDSKEKVLRLLKYVNLGVSFFALCALAYFYGYPQTDATEYFVFGIIRFSFTYYVLQYFVHLFYDFDPLRFLKENWLEGVIMLLLIIEGFADLFLGELLFPQLFVQLGWEGFPEFSTLFIQVYFLIAMITELSRSRQVIPNIRVHPSNLFMLVFLIMIGGGTLLLMMPEMTPGPGNLNFLDALFTSASASCTTGLIVVDTAEAFTFKGQFVILTLIKLGGLNIIAFGVFVSMAGRLGLSVKQHKVIEDFVNESSVLSGQRLFGKVFFWSLLIEGVGVLLLYFLWSDQLPAEDRGERFFYSVFHSLSAFNHAGFSNISGGMFAESVRTNYAAHSVLMALIYIGGLGFVALFDIFSPGKIWRRLQLRWRRFDFHTKLSLYFGTGLVLVGAFLFLILEWNNTLAGKGAVGTTVTAFFQSITARSAGFNTVDIGGMSVPMLIFLLLLMLIGASSSSTSGGIKTTTFGVIWASVWSTIRSFKNVELFKRSISQDLVLRAFTILLFFLFGVFLGALLLSITERELLATTDLTMLDLIFEEVSAFGTVGLSTGVTPQLSSWGKGIIIVSMFVGRVGTLTVAFALTRSAISRNYKYPYGHTMIG